MKMGIATKTSTITSVVFIIRLGKKEQKINSVSRLEVSFFGIERKKEIISTQAISIHLKVDI